MNEQQILKAENAIKKMLHQQFKPIVQKIIQKRQKLSDEDIKTLIQAFQAELKKDL